jgi:hypothetical protein
MGMFVGKIEEMVPMAKTHGLYAPRCLFSEWVMCGETTPNMSFGPKVVDWTCTLRKMKKWFRWQKLMLFMPPIPVFRMGDVQQ